MIDKSCRLSRRQLPSVELDGVIRYSSPREQAEIDWLSGATSSRYSASSSSSNSTNVTGVNYWKRNSRHEESQDCLQEENVIIKNKVLHAAPSPKFKIITSFLLIYIRILHESRYHILFKN